jgi:CDP-glycerol glycerophosphotransferase
VARLPGLRRSIQRRSRRQPDVAFFESWGGRYADSPRAISEELQRRGAPIERVWVLSEGEAPDGATAVRPGSAPYLRAMGRASYVISNNSMPGYYVKKPGSVYLQTWHGTPLKRIGFDIERPNFAGASRYLDNLRRDVACWDYLVSQSAFSSEVFRRAFRYEGPVLETGYPRNDLLRRPDRDELRERVRSGMGIPGDAVVVLYAPTWRDNDSFSLELDLSAVSAALDPGYVLLLRAHHLVASTVRASESHNVRDVSRAQDVTPLLLAADILVTDYSSVMFDFAVTGRPMLFYTYDLEMYRDELRGFYFDFDGDAPGPLLSTTAEVIAAIRELDGVRSQFSQAYDRFARRFCPLDDGHAAARVVDAVFDL